MTNTNVTSVAILIAVIVVYEIVSLRCDSRMTKTTTKIDLVHRHAKMQRHHSRDLSVLLLSVALASSSAQAAPYFHIGFNRTEAGAFFPVAGAVSDKQAGLITPAIEHDAANGYLLVPGISWNPLNLGYIGGTSDMRTFLHGFVAAGPSVQTGDLVKTGLRWVCSVLPQWQSPDRYGAMKSLLAPGGDGFYADIGIYEGLPLNGLGDISHIKPETFLGAVLVKKWGNTK